MAARGRYGGYPGRGPYRRPAHRRRPDRSGYITCTCMRRHCATCYSRMYNRYYRGGLLRETLGRLK